MIPDAIINGELWVIAKELENKLNATAGKGFFSCKPGISESNYRWYLNINDKCGNRWGIEFETCIFLQGSTKGEKGLQVPNWCMEHINDAIKDLRNIRVALIEKYYK